MKPMEDESSEPLGIAWGSMRQIGVTQTGDCSRKYEVYGVCESDVVSVFSMIDIGKYVMRLAKTCTPWYQNCSQGYTLGHTKNVGLKK